MIEYEEYRDAHASGAATEDYSRFRSIIRKDFSKISKHILKNNPEEYLKILDIGGGDGKSLIQIVKPLIKEGRDTLIDYLDVSVNQAKSFLENMDKEGLAEKIDRINITPWENFRLREGHNIHNYNVVLALHSWYGIGNKTKENKHPLEKVKLALRHWPFKGSAGYIVLAGKDNFFDMIGKSIGIHRTIGADVIEKLEKLCIEHEVQEIYDNQFSLKNDLFNGGELTRAGKEVVSYIIRRDFEGLSEEEKTKMRNVFEEQIKNPKYAANDLIIIPGRERK